MTYKDYVLNYIETSGVASGRELIKPSHKDFVSKLTEFTHFLPESAPATLRLRCVIEGITSIPKCDHEDCNNQVNIKSSPILKRKTWR